MHYCTCLPLNVWLVACLAPTDSDQDGVEDALAEASREYPPPELGCIGREDDIDIAACEAWTPAGHGLSPEAPLEIGLNGTGVLYVVCPGEDLTYPAEPDPGAE